MPQRHRWLLIAVLEALCGSACTWGDGPRTAPAQPVVALITLDTWRLDHFSEDHSPHLWELAGRGERFSNAWSPIGLTSPAHATMFTGKMPWEHRMEANNHHGYSLAEAAVTVAERHRDQGWATGAFVSAFPAGPAGGLAQGWEQFSGPEAGERAGEIAVKQALDWLPDDRPALLWVHLYEPHGPYEGTGETDVERYAEEVRRADAALEPLLEELVERGARVVIAGDHGEVLLEERCGRQHERSTSEQVLRVPLARWEPGLQPAVHDGIIGLSEVPALLDGAPLAELPRRSHWLAESGICEAGCAPGCRPQGVQGRDRVYIDGEGRWIHRPGRGTWKDGAPQEAGKALVEGIPPVPPPSAGVDEQSLQQLGYSEP